jgi:hypothetical protein
MDKEKQHTTLTERFTERQRQSLQGQKMSNANSNKKVVLQTPKQSKKAQTTTITTEVQGHHYHLRQALASQFGFLNNANKRKPEIDLLI